MLGVFVRKLDKSAGSFRRARRVAPLETFKRVSMGFMYNSYGLLPFGLELYWYEFAYKLDDYHFVKLHWYEFAEHIPLLV